MEFKGTKGKWNVCEKHGTILCEDKYGIAQVHGIINDDDWKYNAQLISKAPEMLEMLKDILKDRYNDGDYISISDIKNLIEEATKID